MLSISKRQLKLGLLVGVLLLVLGFVVFNCGSLLLSPAQISLKSTDISDNRQQVTHSALTSTLFWSVTSFSFQDQSLVINTKKHTRSRIPQSTTVHGTKNTFHTHTILEDGYILALDYWDQQTSALRNLLGLQCWASHFGPRVSVVEPFVIQSRFGALPKTEEERRGQIRFQDLFDITQWREGSTNHSGSGNTADLVSWSDFLSKAPKQVILVSIAYARGANHYNCTPEFTHKLRKHCTTFLSTHGFQVVRDVCIDMHKMKTAEFDILLFGNLSSLHSATIIFKEWRGINHRRVTLVDSPCDSGVDMALNLRTSSKVISDVKRYIQSYFGEEQVYIALVVRLERIIINSDKSDEGQSLNIVKMCLNNVIDHWLKLKKVFGFRFTFLAIDYGRFGTAGFSLVPSRNKSGIAESVEKFVRRIFGEEMTIRKWDQTFENVTNVTNAGYIAQMQSNIATRSKCIVLAGGGHFQAHTLQLYKQIPRSKQCYIQFDNTCHLIGRSSIPNIHS